jgi:hypothetical protein
MWISQPPTGRVWGLVLGHSNIPAVCQYEPKFAVWTAHDGTTYSSKAIWHLLPYHPDFNSKTHAFQKPTRMERAQFADIEGTGK